MLVYFAGVKVFNRKHQIPISAPDDIAVFKRKPAEFAFVKIFVILRMWMPAYKAADINHTRGVVAERQVHRQVACIWGIGYVKTIHYSLVLITVLFTACFITKNRTHLFIMFLLYLRMKSSAVRLSLSESGSSPAFSRMRISTNSPFIMISSKMLWQPLC